MASVSSKLLTVSPVARHTATIVFLHGLGDTGFGWKPVADMFQRDQALNHIKWILPDAPIKPVTANGGYRMTSWFDIHTFEFDGEEDEKGILESSSKINSIITEEINSGIPPNRIVLGGFSQGGALALFEGLTTNTKPAGLVVMSGWLLLRDKIKSLISEHAKDLPIFWGHGEVDPTVKFELATKSRELLTTKLSVRETSEPGSAGLSFNTYKALGHSADMMELDDLKKWLKNVIPK